ncbi:hypothetical protein ACEWY4_013738 [Coilia grayii]|uniref:C1q domain-containing protein n=1 Tax=Coilia grayii TaxID=363190 RepID=A0ABD1JX88_9TELE
MKGTMLLLVCLGYGMLSAAAAAAVQLRPEERGDTAGSGSMSRSARDEAIENEIEIELPSNSGGNAAFWMITAALDRRIRNTEKRLENLQRENEMLTSSLRAMERRLTYRLVKAESSVKELGRDISERPKIAFSASLGGVGSRGPYNTDTTLTFRDVITNIGNAFRPATGIFTAPVRGVYLFSLFECSLSPQPASLSLHKNEQMMVSVAKRRAQHEGAENGSNGVVLQLEQGDQVYVRLWKDSWVYDSTGHYTTFSGVLLFTL